MAGSLSPHQAPTTPLDDRLIERCEEIPDDPAPGRCVVVDTMHFSNTVIELLGNGADHVHVPDERGSEFEYREDNPDAVLGGEGTGAYEPAAGYDFFNSPSYVQRLDVEGRPVSMTSTNGGRAVTALRERGNEDVEVYVGSTMNAAALGTHLREEGPGRLRLVSAGSSGEIAIEDHVGATLVSHAVDGVRLSETELSLFGRLLETANGPEYVQKHELRHRDVFEYAMAIDSRAVVPKLDGERLVDVGAPTDWSRQDSTTRGRPDAAPLRTQRR
jgi:2-phosphosulfolactate phosphatase